MSFFEKIYKERFSDAGNLDGIDPDAIWEGISEVAPSPVSEIAATKKTGLGLTSYLIGAAGVLAVAGLIFVLTQAEIEIDSSGDPENKETIVEVSKKTKSAEVSIEEIENFANIEIENEKLETNSAFAENQIFEEKEKIQTHSKNVALPLSKKETLSERTNFSGVSSKVKLEGEIVKKETTFNSKAITKTADFQNIVIAANQNQANVDLQNFQDSGSILFAENDKISFAEKSVSRKVIDEFTQLPNEACFIISKTNLQNPPVSITPVGKKVRKKNIKIGIFAGANLTSNSYGENIETSNLNDLLENSHQGLAGYSASAKFYWTPFKKIDFVTGFEYLNTVTKFDYLETGSPEKISRDGRLGIDSVLAIPTRTVVNFNQQNFISIPILVGSSYQFGKFGVGANGGIGLNLFTKQSGKSLSASAKIEDIETAANLPIKKTFISYQINPYFSFRATGKIQLQMQSTFRYQPHGTSDFYNLKHSSVLGGLSFGVLVTP